MQNFDSRKYKILDTLMEHRDLKHVVNLAYEIFGNPIFIVDTSWRMMAKSETHGTELEAYETLMPGGKFSVDIMAETEAKGIFDHLMNSDRPIRGEFSYLKKSLVGCRVRDKLDTICFVTVIEWNRRLEEEDFQLLVLLCKAVLFAILYQERTAVQRVPMFGLFEDILLQKVNKDEIKNMVALLKLKFPEKMRCVVIEDSNLKRGITIQYASQTLFSFQNYLMPFDGKLLVIIDEKECTEETIVFIRKRFENLETQIGISRSFEDIFELQKAYYEAVATNKISRKLNLTDSIHYYEDFFLYHFFELSAKNYDIQKFYDSNVVKLKKYDTENNTELSKVAETYLEVGRNAKKAAEQLFMHRNTFYSKLEKIERICEIDLKDENVCFMMQFTYRLMKIGDAVV